MRSLTILVIPFFLYSCSSNGRQKHSHSAADGKWLISNRTVSRNKYTVGGLLDSTYIVSYHYIKGEFLDSTLSIRTQDYDSHGNLVDEKETESGKGNTRKLIFEHAGSFDKGNRKLFETYRMEEIQWDRYWFTYDTAGLLMRLRSIEQGSQGTATRLTSYIYDKDRNLIRSTTVGPDKKVQRIVQNTYLDKRKTSSITINRKGETVSQDHYFPVDGGRIMHVSETQFGTDTAWSQNGLIIEYRGIINTPNHNIRNRTINKYDSKGNKTESIFYSLSEN